MANLNPKMSASYRAIFILSIFMVFFVLIAGAATKSNGAGLGVLLWGYQAWLMYKRDNTALVSLTKAILWVQAIAFCIVFSVLLFSKSDAKAYIREDYFGDIDGCPSKSKTWLDTDSEISCREGISLLILM